MKLKVCGNKFNLADVAALQPHAMGFIFYDKSPRNVSVEEVKAEVSRIKNILKVGVFVNERKDRIMETVLSLGLDLVQLHGDETPEFCDRLRPRVKVIKALDGNAVLLQNEVDRYAGAVDFFLFDNRSSAYGGTGTKFDHAVLSSIHTPVPYYVAGGIGPGDVSVTKKLQTLENCMGIDVNSGFETSPGLKNTAALKEFKKAINL